MKKTSRSVQNLSAYERSVHLQGRVWGSMALAMMLLAPRRPTSLMNEAAASVIIPEPAGSLTGTAAWDPRAAAAG